MADVPAPHSILMVESDPHVVEMVRAACQSSIPGVALRVLPDADALLAWLGDESGSTPLPHVLLLDLKLPKLDGLAVLRHLRMEPRTSDLLVVAYAGEHTQDEVQLAYRAGANSFIDKPLTQEQFQTFFREQMPYWLTPRQRELFRDGH